MQSESLAAYQDYGFRRWHFSGIILFTACTLRDANSHRAWANSVNPVTLDKAVDVDTVTSHQRGSALSGLFGKMCQPCLLKFGQDVPDLHIVGFSQRADT